MNTADLATLVTAVAGLMAALGGLGLHIQLRTQVKAHRADAVAHARTPPAVP